MAQQVRSTWYLSLYLRCAKLEMWSELDVDNQFYQMHYMMMVFGEGDFLFRFHLILPPYTTMVKF